MIKFLAILWLRLRVIWSNFHNRNNLKDCEVIETAKTPVEIVSIGIKNYSNFEYTYDSPQEFFDSMRFPAQCYNDLKSDKLRDDCDGWHAAMYHVCIKNNFNDTYLLTYISKDLVKSHTVLLSKWTTYWWVLDYKALLPALSVEELLHRLEVNHNTKIIAWNITKFNYNKNKYEIVKKGECNGCFN